MDSPDFLGNPKSGENFIIDDLFDFSNEEVAIGDGGCSHFDTLTGDISTDSSTVTVVDSPGDLPAAHFSADLCLPPCEEFPELEWFSRLEEESFSSEDLEKLQLISGMKAPATSIATTTDVNISRMGSESPMLDNEDDHNRNNNNIILISNNQILGPEISVPGKARSKRPRATTCNWSSRLPTIATMSASSSTSSDQSEMVFNNYNYENYSSFAQGDQVKKNKTIVKVKTNNIKKQQQQCGEGGGGGGGGGEGSGRRCLHCATEKTPQWRTGPMGPKTLCNACGVRYKSGRLVPEYRPAASPTFLQTKHSNSHRKVLELRRQKEVVLQQPLQQQQQQHNQLFQLCHHQSNAGAMFDQLSGSDQGYLIHHHIGPDFRQLL